MVNVKKHESLFSIDVIERNIPIPQLPGIQLNPGGGHKMTTGRREGENQFLVGAVVIHLHANGHILPDRN